MNTMITSSDLIKNARRYIGVQYRHQGRTRFGLDCLGLVLLALWDCGLEIAHDTPTYSPQVDSALLLSALDPHTEITQAIKPGTLLIFRISKTPQHLAIATGVNTIIHAYQGGPMRVVEHELVLWWAQRIAQIRTINYVNHET